MDLSRPTRFPALATNDRFCLRYPSDCRLAILVRDNSIRFFEIPPDPPKANQWRSASKTGPPGEIDRRVKGTHRKRLLMLASRIETLASRRQECLRWKILPGFVV